MTNLETTLRQIIADVVREELRAAFPYSTPRHSTDAGARYVSPMQAATIASVSTRAVRLWIHQGRLPAFHAGRLVRVSLDDLRAFLEPKSYDSPCAPEQEADLAFERRHARDTTRCPDCGHLQMWHLRGGCRAKKCTCQRRIQ